MVAVPLVGLAVLIPGSAVAVQPAAAPPTAHTAEDPGHPTFLWALNGTSGTIERRSGDRLTLRVRGVAGYVTQFTDRPIRDAFAVSKKAFVSRWDDMFADDHPNAVLSFVPPGSTRTQSIVLTLHDARLRNGTIVFPATRILRQVDPAPLGAPGQDPRNVSTPSSFNSPSLFIDNVADDQNRPFAEVFFMPSGRVPSGDLLADGRQLPIGPNTKLYAATYGGPPGPNSTFPIPNVTPTWPVMTSATATVIRGGWVINNGGEWAPYGPPETLLPGQVFFTAAYRYDPSDAGGVQTTLGGTVPAGMRAFEFPDVTRPGDGTQFIGEMRLIRTTAGIPRFWLPADGSRVTVNDNAALFSILGNRFGGDDRSQWFGLPKASAPTGYTWIIATHGYYPSQW